MSTKGRPTTSGRARLPFSDAADLEEFVEMLDRFERGAITADAWRDFRLVHGTYGQRQPEDVHMLRVKIPQGLLTADQMIALADVADAYSRGFGHITTRQNVQFHFVRLADVEPALRRLAEAGLTTREACGNSVRNVTTCPFAGVAADEVFDVTPYAEALSRHFLRHPLSSSLPRKFKIAFEGCPGDHVKVAINDIGWQARVDGNRRGFRVVIGGGTSTMATSATELFGFLPAEQMLDVAEAIIRLFHELGDREHRSRNRMKFLVRSLGWDAWRGEFGQRLEAVRAEGTRRLSFDPHRAAFETAPVRPSSAPPPVAAIAERVQRAGLRGPGLRPEPRPATRTADERFARWIETNVLEQRQAGYATATVTVSLGDVAGEQLRVLAEIGSALADGTTRVTGTQNLVLRWVPVSRLRALYDRLVAAGLGEADADTLADVTTCPGAESCRLAVTQSRGLGRLLEQHARAAPSLVSEAPGLDVKVSGCPNGCGQHHVAAVGFQGSLRKVGRRAAPYYFVLAGGGVDEHGASFGRLVAKVPVRRSPAALARLARLFAAERRPGESAAAFFARCDGDRLTGLLRDLEPLTEDEATAEDFVDLGESEPFSLETQKGECSA